MGSDSNIRIALSEELRTLEYSQRLRDKSRAALATAEAPTGRRLFGAVVAGGAQAAGRPSGQIAPGQLADLMALDDRHVDLIDQSGYKCLDCWVCAGDDHMVRDTITAAYVKAMRPLRGAL